MEKTELRIVSGSLRGRKITVFVHEEMRPTPQMVREALFSILGNAVPGRIFYDIFAGTGIVGIEAVSRGASSARLIERDSKQASEIHKQIVRFEIEDKAQVLRADAYRWAERWIPTANVPVNIFLSPPFPDLDAAKAKEFLDFTMTLFAKAPDESVLILQAEDGFPLGDLPEPHLWDTRKYGRNLLLFRVKGDGAEAAVPVEEAAD